MARIEDMDRIGTAIPPSDPLVDVGLQRDVPVAVPLDIFAKEQLITLMSVVRRPPEMPLSVTGEQQQTNFEDVDAVDMDPVLASSASNVAYQVASLAVRRESEIAASGDLGAMRGQKALEQLSRMFEHLHILKTTTPGT